MRKLTCMLLALLLVGSLAITVNAEIDPPVINTTVPDCYANVNDGNTIMLFVDATAPDGELEYQWYLCDPADHSRVSPLENGNKSECAAIELSYPGTSYYTCWVRCKFRGQYSDWVKSRVIQVEYGPDLNVELAVEKAPNKTTYYAGEYLDLTGLQVRIIESNGYRFSYNGEGLTINKGPYTTLGEQKVAVRYGNGFDIFIITVVEPPHTTHSFGEWMTTTQPGCETAGQRVRECNCGATEKEDIPATGHSWDEGTVTKEPTADSEGTRRFVCTLCKQAREEVIDKLTGEATEATTATGATDTTEPLLIMPGPATPVTTGTDSGDTGGDTPWWILAIIIVAAAGIVTGAALLVFRKKKMG